MLQVHDKFFKPFISRDEIQKRIAELGKQLDVDYNGLNPLFIGILNGAFIFAADLFRASNIQAEITFTRLTSYQGTASTGTVVTSLGLNGNLHGRHVIVVEDIVDTGKTLAAFLPQIQSQNPASLRIATFLNKADALQHNIKADYIGFEIPDKFVVGYGLDYDGLGRNLPDLYVIAD